MTDTEKPNEVQEGPSASKAMLYRQTLHAGFVVHINGLPFRLDGDVIVSGHKRNFVAADLLMDGKNTSV